MEWGGHKLEMDGVGRSQVRGGWREMGGAAVAMM